MKIEVRKPTLNEKKEASSWHIWEKEVSEFQWEYDAKETCLIIDGKGIVKTGSGEVSFGPGDWVVFPKGLKCSWKIIEPIKKNYKFG